MTDDLDGMLATMEQDDVLARLDSILQEKRFTSITSRSVCMGIDHDSISQNFGDELLGTGSALRERYDRWDELVRQKMPHSHGRGILSTVHNMQEHYQWGQYMGQYMRRIRISMAAKQTGAEGEVQPEGRLDDEGPRGVPD